MAGLLLLAAPAMAGLSVQSMQSRHRSLLNPDQAGPGLSAPSSVAVQLGKQPDAAPALVDDAPVGGPGLRFSVPVIERGEGPGGLEVRLGAVVRGSDPDIKAEGSSIRLPLGPGELYASYEPRHWGPGWFGSLILDAAAPSLAGFGWQLGGEGVDLVGDPHWQIDLFAGTLRGHSQPADPWLIGMRLVWRPTHAWTIGLARTMQWGGEGRDESAGSFWRALIGDDNPTDDGFDESEEPGNQLAGFDLRYDLRWTGGNAGVYGQLIGEDEASYLPSRKIALGGFDVGQTFGSTSLRLIAEWTETRAGVTGSRQFPGRAYRHHLYVAGYTHGGLPIGHPIGGDVRLTSLGLLVDQGPVFALLSVHDGQALKRVQRFPDGASLRGADLALMMDVPGGMTVGASAHLWRTGSSRERWVGVWAQYEWR